MSLPAATDINPVPENPDGQSAQRHFLGKTLEEAEAVQAERRVVAGLKRLGWSEADLRARRKGESRKVELAWELRSQTTMPLAWIAESLSMGTRGHLAWCCNTETKAGSPHPLTNAC